MKKENMSDLLEISGMIKSGYSSIISNAGRIVAVITLIIAVLVTFTDMTLSNLTSESFTTTLAVMLISSYLMYFSLEDAGEREGEATDEFRLANERYTAARSRITPDSIDALRSFCLEYTSRELEYRRLSYLSERGYSKGDLKDFRAGKGFPRRARRAFRRAERMKQIKLTPAVLMSGARIGERGELINPRRRKLFDALVSLIPSTVCMIFTISVILTAKENMTVSTVIDGIVKLSALPIIGFKGMLDGYRFSKDDKSVWLEGKARLLESFIEANRIYTEKQGITP